MCVRIEKATRLGLAFKQDALVACYEVSATQR